MLAYLVTQTEESCMLIFQSTWSHVLLAGGLAVSVNGLFGGLTAPEGWGRALGSAKTLISMVDWLSCWLEASIAATVTAK